MSHQHVICCCYLKIGKFHSYSEVQSIQSATSHCSAEILCHINITAKLARTEIGWFAIFNFFAFKYTKFLFCSDATFKNTPRRNPKNIPKPRGVMSIKNTYHTRYTYTLAAHATLGNSINKSVADQHPPRALLYM